ncbi:MAG: proline iminopeptidase-family hydrolase [Gammaproteobacteria bacterium]|nr:proline iminopeptidase-family hydrolase [Gammaproteobacteria bacterium]
MNDSEGKIKVDGHNVWYRRMGSGGVPLLTLHGGPGAGHDYLEPLAGLAEQRPVIFFDQLGCGRSDQPDDTSLWRIERFVSEVDQVRDALGLGSVHLFGQSWGGWLAIEYMLHQPRGVIGLVLASTSASLPQFTMETRKLIANLPQGVQETLQRYEDAGDYENEEYEAAVMEFYKRHLCRLDPFPEPLARSAEIVHNNPVYLTMNGPNEFTHTGNLKNWDRSARLDEIRTPTLITVGRYDELTPACAETLRDGIPNAKMVIFEDSAHVAHLEETERYLETLGDFLARAESAAVV